MCNIRVSALIISLTLSPAVNAVQVLEVKEGLDIFGSSELPKGLTIIPWKVQAPDVAVEKLYFTVADEIFQPIDRAVFQRQLNYYRDLFPVHQK